MVELGSGEMSDQINSPRGEVGPGPAAVADGDKVVGLQSAPTLPVGLLLQGP